MTSFFTYDELQEIGFAKVGKNNLISKKISIYSPEKMIIGNNVRIDDFCIISGRIKIGNNIHIAAYSGLFGGIEGITINDFANISSKNMIYALSDDFSGETMTNPMIPDKYKNVIHKEVIVERHVILGSGCVVLPGTRLREGSAFGSLSLVNVDSLPWTINAGIPAKKIKTRSNNLLELEEKYLSEGLE